MKNFLLLSLLLLLAACQTDKPITVPNGKFYTILPCKDCETVHYSLMLKDDQIFEEEIFRHGAAQEVVINSGTYRVDADSVLHLDGTALKDYSQLYLHGKHLMVIGIDGKDQPMQTQVPDRYSLRPAPEAPARPRRAIVLTGNEPFWHIVIEEDGATWIKTLDTELDLNLPTGSWTGDFDTALPGKIKVEGDGTTLMIDMKAEKCSDSMSGQAYTHQVQVLISSTQLTSPGNYTGCGQIVDHYQYNGLWTLTHIDSKSVPTDNDRPDMDLQMANGIAHGFGGCNRYRTNFRIKDGSFDFDPVAMTKMACEGPMMPIEAAWTRIISEHTMTPQRKDDELSLRGGGHELTFAWSEAQ